MVFPDASVAVPVTVVVPSAKIDPEVGNVLTVAPGQLSDIVGKGNVTADPVQEASDSTVTFEGHVILGFCASFTVTVKLHALVLLEASVAVQLTVVIPFAKVEPDAGVQTAV